MSSVKSYAERHRTTRSYAEVSRNVFVLMWMGFLALHALCMGYFVFVARFYTVTPKSNLAHMLLYYKVGLDPKHYPVLAAVFRILSGYHAVQMVWMILYSMIKRRWSVSVFQEFAFQETMARAVSIQRRRAANHTLFAKRFAFLSFDKVFGRQGLLGVEGKYFELVLIVREIVETALQSKQAYTMSIHVPRPWLNRLYVVLIVMNCLLTPILHVVFATNHLMRRTALLACDAILDLFSSVILSSILIICYLRDYDRASENFPVSLWLNDLWFVNASNELELLLVSSWSELVTNVMFAVAFITCLENAKSLIRVRSASDIHPSTLSEPPPKLEPKSTSTLIIPTQSTRHRVERMAHVLFGVWGIVVLALHLHAEQVPTVPQCAMQVRPWTVSKPACAMVLLDCHQCNIVGNRDQVASEWMALEHVYTVRLVIRHCTQLQMAPELQLFRSLKAFKLYNSTIDDWSADAALTTTHHLRITAAMFIRVLFPKGQLPPGLLSTDFPKALLAFQVCTSNLHTLPDDLDTKWPLHAYYLFEKSEFTTIPAELERLRPQQISFAYNRLSQFPFQAFTWPNLYIMNVGGNAINTLMDETTNNVTNISTSVYVLVFAETNVTILPNWIDQVLLAKSQVPRLRIYASNTPLCRNADRIQRGELSAFPGTEESPPGSLSFTMTVTAPHTNPLLSLGVCMPYSTLFYPLVFDDSVNRLNNT